MEFVARIDPETGDFVFPDKSMERLFKEVTSFYGQTGKYFRFALLDDVRPTTDNQIKLFKRLCFMIAEESGMTYEEVFKALHTQHAPKEVEEALFGVQTKRVKNVTELDQNEFRHFLDNCILTANDMYGMNLELYHNDVVGTVLKNKKG